MTPGVLLHWVSPYFCDFLNVRRKTVSRAQINVWLSLLVCVVVTALWDRCSFKISVITFGKNKKLWHQKYMGMSHCVNKIFNLFLCILCLTGGMQTNYVPVPGKHIVLLLQIFSKILNAYEKVLMRVTLKQIFICSHCANAGLPWSTNEFE